MCLGFEDFLPRRREETKKINTKNKYNLFTTDITDEHRLSMIEKYIKHRGSFGSHTEIENLENKYPLPEDYLAFMRKHGAFEFGEMMLITVSNIDYSVDTFLNVCEIKEKLKDFLLPKNFFPIADGQLGGDLIGINLVDHSIVYLYHDRDINEKPILLSDSFGKFITLVYKDPETKDDNRKITDVQISDEFLQLLKNRKQ